MKIYTRTGDLGETSTLKSQRISKSSLKIRASGSVDELNSVIGLLLAYLDYGVIKEKLIRIQNELFELGADISSGEIDRDYEKYRIDETHIRQLEKEIDEIDTNLPPLKNFILPGGSVEGAYTHLARNVCRRAERELVNLNLVEHINPFILSYLNRLSDWLFVIAREINRLKGIPELKFKS